MVPVGLCMCHMFLNPYMSLYVRMQLSAGCYLAGVLHRKAEPLRDLQEVTRSCTDILKLHACTCPMLRHLNNREMHDVPDEIFSLWQKAVQTNCRSAKTQLFYKWLEAGKDYGRCFG